MVKQIGPKNSEIARDLYANLKKLTNYYEVMNIDVDILQNLVEKLKLEIKFIISARTIQRFFRKYLFDKVNNQLLKIQTLNAIKIQ